MVDYSRIDWVKCKLKPLPCLMADGETQQLTVQAAWDASHGNAVITVSGYYMMAKTGSGSIGWKFLHCNVASTADQALELIERAKEVNAFITTEAARIEAEDEVANFVKVPWQDVEFLVSSGSTVANSLYIMNHKTVGVPSMEYTADRRTFPTGYDPENPRWVEVDSRDVARLRAHRCTLASRPPRDSFSWSPLNDKATEHAPISGFAYAIDIHTLPPGVPLHEEPKPWRPCSKEFALSHPKESEARHRFVGKWTAWSPVDAFAYEDNTGCYEFRTTAKAEPKSMVVAETQVESLVNGLRTGGNDGKFVLSVITKSSPSGIKNALIFEVTADCKEFKNPRIALIVDEVES